MLRPDDEGPDEQGFTLVELLVVMLLMGIIGAFTLTGLVQGLETSNTADRRVQALTDLQQSGQRVARELRMACRVETAQPDVAAVDVLRDGTRYRYTISVGADGVLRADVDIISGSVLTDHRIDRIAEGIVNGDFLFTYFDEDGNATSVPSEVRDVRVELEREAVDDEVRWTSDLHLRNGGLSCGF